MRRLYQKGFKDRWLYLPVIILLLYFLYRLIDQSKLLFYFPLDYTNDISSYMAQLFFLKGCGFLEFCPYWYNGFTAFQFTPPGWFFFALPFYYLFGDVKIAAYFTMVLSFILIFLIIYFAGKYFNLSKIKRIAFFTFLFATSFSIGSFVRLGRVHELFAWVWFLLFAFFVLYYKDRKLNAYSLLIIPFYSLTLLSYLSTCVLASLLFLGLFIIKPNKEKLILALYFISSLLLISFWLFPFVKGVFTASSIPTLTQNTWLWQFGAEHIFTNIAIFLLPLMLFFLFYLYWRNNKKSRKELYFFTPILILALAYFLRLTPFIPIFKNIFPDPYLPFFLFFTLFFFFKIDYSRINKNIIKFMPVLLIIFALVSIAVNVFHTPKFIVPDDKANIELKPLLDKFEGSFMIFGELPRTIYIKALYSYAPIYHNLSTPYGWYPEVKEPSYLEIFDKINYKDCSSFVRDIKYLNTTHVIGYKDACKNFDKCSLTFLESNGDFCLYLV